MFYEGKNVLVAGGAGMTGQNLVQKLLAQGAYVRATQHTSGKITLRHKNLEVVDCDLLDGEQARSVFKDMRIVFIAAGKVRGAKTILEDPSGPLMYNLELQSKLIHLSAKTQMERCAFISSSYIYPLTDAPNVESEGFKDNPWMPMNYGSGWVKRYLETLCKHFHMVSSTEYAIVRPVALYGPYDNYNLEECHVVPALIVKAVNQMNPYEVWGNGEDIRSFTQISDFVDGLMLTTAKYAVAEPLNICTRETHTVKQVAETIFDILDFHPKIEFNTDKPSVIPYRASDPSRAKELLNWEAKITLKEGLQQTIEWYTQHQSWPST